MIALLPFPDIDPVLVSFEILGREFAIHWYAIAYIVGFLLAWRWIIALVARPQLWRDDTAPMQKQHVEDLLTWMVIGTILGGRIGYILFYNFGEFIAEPARILRIWEGGMSFHGGFIGVVLAGLLFCWKNKLPAWSVGDAIASSAPFGLFLGRIANFINAELWGRPTDAPWGVIFPTEAAQSCGQALGELCARHPSQLYEAMLEGLILFAAIAYLILRRNALKTPGIIIGVFFLGYGLARTFVEGFRQADAQFITSDNPFGRVIRLGTDVDSFGLSMGQLLSLPMVFIGIAIIIYAKRRT
ncbi:prolipoprotein diacylglyceryl transferase [Amylibacter ulvae]|uniref:Phosphatidylglycerol--prolipoprotein diacylglyceryl transferase n=1 Tax=Paramylibacter ulvae TaxID=1651968 RepID=A0ABQ3D847_9RHOB|nr:prolipoprotein diacylglyceryl transferase [Amylibacter ulvae]GHA62526.1 prolipoprotein diacylglyceryl transferase [Amylibacter ulvae]